MAIAAVTTRTTNDTSNLPVYQKMAMQAQELFLQVCDEQTWKRELSFALQILEGNKLLQSVAQTPAGAQSIKNAIVNVAMTGTTLNPVLQKAYLVPRSVKGVMMCCLDFSYRGLAGIAMDSGSVKHLAPRLVYTFDTFDYTEEDGEQHITFKKNMLPPEEFTSGPSKFWEYALCGYLVATMHDGSKIVTEPLPKWKLKKAMDTSMTNGDKTPWRTHPDEQCLKTIVKHAYKLLPQTDRMSQAVDVLNQHEGIDTEDDRRNLAKASVSTMFGVVEDASFTTFPGNEAATIAQSTSVPGEVTSVPVVTPEQCAEILRRAEEAGIVLDQLLIHLEVKNLADLPQNKYGTTLTAIESRRRSNESRANGSSAPVAAAPQDLNEVVNALAAKNLNYQMDESASLVQVKINYQDASNKEFVKSIGFKWDAEGKVWIWKK